MRFIACFLSLSLASAGSVLAQSPALASAGPLLLSSPAASAAPRAAPTPSPLFKPDSIFVNPQMRPQFTGGDVALRAYLMKNLHYPELALRQHVTGKVYVCFILNAAGHITDASVVRGPGSGLNEEALRLVWLMPNWVPARQQGQAVRVSCTLPIEFQE